MADRFRYLVIADESPEFPAALTYAARRAKLTDAGVVLLRVIAPTPPAEWVAVSEEIRRQAADAAEALAERYAAEVWAESGLTVEIIVREGDLKAEIKRLIDEDPSIKVLALAAGAGAGGPGPLVTLAARGQSFAARAVPVLIVPGALPREQLLALAEPDGGVASAPQAPPAA